MLTRPTEREKEREKTDHQNQEWREAPLAPEKLKELYKELQWTILCQQLKQLRWNGKIPRKTESTETDSGRIG